MKMAEVDSCLFSSNTVEILRVGGIYYHQSAAFTRRYLWDLSRCIKADGGHPAGIIIEYG